ncbi:hypothetical protein CHINAEXTREME_07905 [Halobiforma lacisalsi AJ5]|uniref:Uncharacterized protein n=1 Tax=Natronobacterium lacisalsi AJ5 TaxID=358396 RepID=M0LWN1_NATLA|nr:DUF6149 family protein [Halobiforma lacisalsi]APW97701.1 hypothetical protein CHINAEXTREME_07905 [Halobiforma lacisalsi AJ5]EMA37553.1 hypothetical protein C445_01661 [Halobiforma lacisalsi AJ5]
MKLQQNVRHFASRKALETPVVRSAAKSGLVRLHTRVFLGKADPERADERKDHLDGLFDATVDTYLRALQDGYSEAEAREITHIQANFDFYNHGWTEMMEFPVDELEAHYDRYRDFFETWDVTIDDPLGQFAPRDGLPPAPSTPEKLEDPEHPHAEGGFADDAYVETEDGELVVGGRDEPDEVDVSKAVGVEDSSENAAEN